MISFVLLESWQWWLKIDKTSKFKLITLCKIVPLRPVKSHLWRPLMHRIEKFTGLCPRFARGFTAPPGPSAASALILQMTAFVTKLNPFVENSHYQKFLDKSMEGVKNVSFSENFEYVLNERSHIRCSNLFMIWFDSIFTIWIGRASQDEQLYVFHCSH